MHREPIQENLKILFDLIKKGQIKFSKNVPQTLKSLQRVRQHPNGSFDLSTVEPPVKALCNLTSGLSNKNSQNSNTNELPPIDLPEIEKERKNENEFMKDIIDVSNIVIKYLILVAGLYLLKK